MIMAKRSEAKEIFLSALEAASPYEAVKKNVRLSSSKGRDRLDIGPLSFDPNKFKRIYVIGAGKASCGMARAVEEALGRRLTGGSVVTRYGYGERLKGVQVIEAGHPIPDRNGIMGAIELTRIAEHAWPEDLVICLISGGASALLPAPVPGVTLRDKQRATRLLIESGATIHEINAVRKHISMIKGGHLLKAASPARVVSLIISDVVGDDISSIASGPTAPDSTTYMDAISVLKKYKIASRVPAAVIKHLKNGVRGTVEETPKPGDKIFAGCDNLIVADNGASLEAAKKKAVSLGYKTLILSSSVTGHSRDTADFLCAVIREIKKSGNPVGPPACILLGGETTVELKGKGLGGRMQEFALAAALRLGAMEGVTLLAAGTDGTDGPTDAAGAFADSKTLKKARQAGMDPSEFLENNDSHTFFKEVGGLFKTGPTGTNVMDVIVAIIE
ncbi:MAG: glycerate kinase [Deltaproteobacteria bacterium]|nr:glycerate kinase [Deltaproteobacteria bacterium]